MFQQDKKFKVKISSPQASVNGRTPRACSFATETGARSYALHKCIEAKKKGMDLEVTIIPLTDSQPEFSRCVHKNGQITLYPN